MGISKVAGGMVDAEIDVGRTALETSPGVLPIGNRDGSGAMSATADRPEQNLYLADP